MRPSNLLIWRYRLVWHSIACWRPRLRQDLAWYDAKPTQNLIFVKIRREFSPDFTNAICFVVSCVTEIKPRRSLGLHKILECRLYPWLLQERLQGRVWEPKFLDFLPEVSSLGDRSSGSTVILINYYRHFNPDANSIFSAVSLKMQIWLPLHLNQNESTGIFFQVQVQYTKVLLEWYLANKNLWVCNSTALFVEKSIFSGRVLLGKKMFNVIYYICTT